MKINSQSMKLLNEQLIVRILVEKGPLSQVELSRITKLTPSTISRIVFDLIKIGLVEKGKRIKTNTLGRKATSLLLTKNFCSSVVFNVGVEQTEVAVGYLDKSTKKLYTFPTGTLSSFIERVNEFLNLLRNEQPVSSKYTSIVFAFPGIVDPQKAEVIYAPNLNWRNVKLAELIHYNYPIFADNEANLSILAESALSNDVKKFGNAFFLYISQGIGGGAIINNKILRGARFAGGEIGHTVVEARSNTKCHCGNYGCLERFASLLLPIAEYEKNGKKLKGKTLGEKFDSLIKINNIGEQRAKEALKGFLYYLSIGLINIVNTFNPNVIILGGDSNSIWKNFGEELYKTISKRTMPKTLEGVIFRDTIFDKGSASIVGGNMLAIEHIIETLS